MLVRTSRSYSTVELEHDFLEQYQQKVKDGKEIVYSDMHRAFLQLKPRAVRCM